MDISSCTNDTIKESQKNIVYKSIETLKTVEQSSPCVKAPEQDQSNKDLRRWLEADLLKKSSCSLVPLVYGNFYVFSRKRNSFRVLLKILYDFSIFLCGKSWFDRLRFCVSGPTFICFWLALQACLAHMLILFILA